MILCSVVSDIFRMEALASHHTLMNDAFIEFDLSFLLSKISKVKI